MTLISPESSIVFLLLFSGSVHLSLPPPPFPYCSKQNWGLVKESSVWVVSSCKLLAQKPPNNKNNNKKIKPTTKPKKSNPKTTPKNQTTLKTQP